MDNEKLAEQLYTSLIETLRDTQMMGLLAAAGDAKSKVPYDRVSPKTRMVFRSLADNLTRIQAKG